MQLHTIYNSLPSGGETFKCQSVMEPYSETHEACPLISVIK